MPGTNTADGPWKRYSIRRFDRLGEPVRRRPCCDFTANCVTKSASSRSSPKWLWKRIRVVDRHLIGRPDVDARDAGPPRRAGAGKTLVDRDDGLALRIMSGDDAAYFECHGFPP